MYSFTGSAHASAVSIAHINADTGIQRNAAANGYHGKPNADGNTNQQRSFYRHPLCNGNCNYNRDRNYNCNCNNNAGRNDSCYASYDRNGYRRCDVDQHASSLPYRAPWMDADAHCRLDMAGWNTKPNYHSNDNTNPDTNVHAHEHTHGDTDTYPHSDPHTC